MANKQFLSLSLAYRLVNMVHRGFVVTLFLFVCLHKRTSIVQIHASVIAGFLETVNKGVRKRRKGEETL